MSIVTPVGFGLAQIRFQVIGGTRESVTTFGYDPPTVNPGANAFAIHGALTAANRPCVAANICTGWSYIGVRVTEMDDTGPVSGQYDANVVGSLVGNPMTPNVSVLLRKGTASGGRRNRGRMFLPPIYPGEENVGPSGTIANTQLGNLNLWWENFRAAMTTAALPLVLFHSEPPYTPTVVTGLVAQQTVATQRRRLRRS